MLSRLERSPPSPFELLCRASEIAAAELQAASRVLSNSNASPIMPTLQNSLTPTSQSTQSAATPAHSSSRNSASRGSVSLSRFNGLEDSKLPRIAKPVRTTTKNLQRTFACPFDSCSKTFARVYNLKAHQRVHSQEMPYSCGKCSKRFRWRSSLTSHRKFHLKIDRQQASSSTWNANRNGDITSDQVQKQPAASAI